MSPGHPEGKVTASSWANRQTSTQTPGGRAEGSGHVETGKLSAERRVQSITRAQVRSRATPAPPACQTPTPYRPAEAPGLSLQPPQRPELQGQQQRRRCLHLPCWQGPDDDVTSDPLRPGGDAKCWGRSFRPPRARPAWGTDPRGCCWTKASWEQRGAPSSAPRKPRPQTGAFRSAPPSPWCSTRAEEKVGAATWLQCLSLKQVLNLRTWVSRWRQDGRAEVSGSFVCTPQAQLAEVNTRLHLLHVFDSQSWGTGRQ